jgi:hypothetical protein
MPVIFALIFVYMSLWIRSSQQARLLSTGLVAAAGLYIAAHAFGRAYSISGSILDFRLTAHRFAFLLVPCVFIAWSVLIFDQRGLSARSKNLAFLFMILVQLATTALSGSHALSSEQVKSWELFASQLYEARGSLAGTQIDDVPLAPVHGGVAWGLIHCDTSNERYVSCSDQRGNRDGAVYMIPRLNSKTG